MAIDRNILYIINLNISFNNYIYSYSTVNMKRSILQFIIYLYYNIIVIIVILFVIIHVKICLKKLFKNISCLNS